MTKSLEPVDHAKPSSGSAHGSLHTEKKDIPEYGKKVSNVAEPSQGGSNPAGKDSSNPCDAKGDPGRYKRNESTAVTTRSEEAITKLREKQLDTDKSDEIAGNMYQAN